MARPSSLRKLDRERAKKYAIKTDITSPSAVRCRPIRLRRVKVILRNIQKGSLGSPEECHRDLAKAEDLVHSRCDGKGFAPVRWREISSWRAPRRRHRLPRYLKDFVLDKTVLHLIEFNDWYYGEKTDICSSSPSRKCLCKGCWDTSACRKCAKGEERVKKREGASKNQRQKKMMRDHDHRCSARGEDMSYLQRPQKKSASKRHLASSRIMDGEKSEKGRRTVVFQILKDEHIGSDKSAKSSRDAKNECVPVLKDASNITRKPRVRPRKESLKNGTYKMTNAAAKKSSNKEKPAAGSSHKKSSTGSSHKKSSTGSSHKKSSTGSSHKKSSTGSSHKKSSTSSSHKKSSTSSSHQSKQKSDNQLQKKSASQQTSNSTRRGRPRKLKRESEDVSKSKTQSYNKQKNNTGFKCKCGSTKQAKRLKRKDCRQHDCEGTALMETQHSAAFHSAAESHNPSTVAMCRPMVCVDDDQDRSRAVSKVRKRSCSRRRASKKRDKGVVSSAGSVVPRNSCSTPGPSLQERRAPSRGIQRTSKRLQERENHRRLKEVWCGKGGGRVLEQTGDPEMSTDNSRRNAAICHNHPATINTADTLLQEFVSICPVMSEMPFSDEDCLSLLAETSLFTGGGSDAVPRTSMNGSYTHVTSR